MVTIKTTKISEREQIIIPKNIREYRNKLVKEFRDFITVQNRGSLQPFN